MQNENDIYFLIFSSSFTRLKLKYLLNNNFEIIVLLSLIDTSFSQDHLVKKFVC